METSKRSGPMAIQQTLLWKSVTNWCRPPHPSAGWVSRSGRIQGTIVRQRVDRMLKTGPAHMFILKNAKKTAKVKGSIHVNSPSRAVESSGEGQMVLLKAALPWVKFGTSQTSSSALPRLLAAGDLRSLAQFCLSLHLAETSQPCTYHVPFRKQS